MNHIKVKVKPQEVVIHQGQKTECGPFTAESKVDELSANAKSLQSCPTLCDPIDGSSPGSPIPGTGTLEWVAISFSNAGK